MRHAPRNYPLLLASQFLGAFGDNFLLAAILAPLTFQKTAGQITEQALNAANARFNAVFFIAFIVLAPLAGFLNDRMPKTTWLTGGNLLKLTGTGVGLLGVWLHPDVSARDSLWQLVGYFVVGIGACVYSPAKYGILPEILPAERLVKANGTVEMLTLVAILGGLGGGAVVFDRTRSLVACYGAALALYVLALFFNALMTATPCNPRANFRRSVAEFGTTIGELVRHPRLGRVLLGCCFFWFAGAVMRSNLQAWGVKVFEAAGLTAPEITNTKLIPLKIAMILGVVGGSLVVGQLHRVGDLSWIRRYGLAMATCILLLGLLGGKVGVLVMIVVLVLAGICAGLLIVPLNASLQHESDHTRLGKTISIQNFFDYFAMLLGTIFLSVLTKHEASAFQVFIALPAVLVVIAAGLRMPSLTQPEKAS